MLGPKASALVVPLLIAVAIAAFFGVFVQQGLGDAGQRSLLTSYDLHSFFLPKFAHGSAELAAGRLPLWNPYEYAGVPFLAEAQPAVFYPPKALLFGLLDPIPAYWAFLVLHYVALAAGFLLFLHQQGITGPAAFVGVAFWTLAVPVLGSNYHPTRVANLIFVPVVFYLVERTAKGGGWRTFAWLALAVAMQLLAGYPEFALDLAILVAVHAVARWANKEWPTPPWKTVPIFAAGFALAGLVAGVQLVPLVEAALVAKRSAVADSVMSVTISPPTEWSGPGFVGSPAFLAFIAVGFLQKRARAALMGFAACFIISQGGWKVLRLLPGFSMLRFPYLWYFLSPFFVAWVAAIGCDTFVRDQRGAGRLERAGVALVGAVGALWAGYAAVRWYHLHVGALPPTGRWLQLARNVGTRPAAIFGVLGGLGLALYSLPSVRSRFGATAVSIAALFVTLAHEASYPFGAFPAPVARPDPEGEVRRLLGHGVAVRGRVFSMNDIQYGYGLTDHIPSVLGAEESFVPWRYRLVIEGLELWPIFDHLNWTKFGSASGFLDALDVDVVVVPLLYARTLARLGFQVVRRGAGLVLMRNPDPMGHAWVSYAVRVIRSADAAREYVMGREFDPHREVVLEAPPLGTYPPSSTEPATLPRAEHRVSATLVEYDVDLPRPGVLVASESYYPGWRASVDGRPTEILVADYLLRGVELAAGSHRVRFEYRPSSIRVGAAMSGVGMVLLAGLFIASRRARPSRPSRLSRLSRLSRPSKEVA
jgi:hypothetical protein